MLFCETSKGYRGRPHTMPLRAFNTTHQITQYAFQVSISTTQHNTCEKPPRLQREKPPTKLNESEPSNL